MPEELKKDVNAEVTSSSEQVVKESEQVVTDQQSAEQEQQQTETASETAEVKDTGEVDERGVPWKNVAHEALRKVSELQASLPNMLKSALQETQGQQQEQKPQYSKAQLRAFAEQATDPTQKVWALEEIDKLDKIERTSEMRQLFEGYTKKTQEEVTRGQAVQFVAQNFPECFVKDANGAVLSWDNSSPLTQKISEYMRNPSLSQNPEGLVAAAKMAAFDLGVSMNKNLVNKINRTTAELRKEQKKQLITGVGTQAQTEGANSKLIKLAETYKNNPTKENFTALAKARGLIPQL